MHTHLRLFWGAVDLDVSDSYSAPDRHSGGASAKLSDGGIGLRRASIVFSADPPGSFSDDVRLIHFDWMNFTGGSPDDSWTTGDFTTMEANIATWWTTIRAFTNSELTFREIRWYRLGSGIVPPNPAERVHAVGEAGSASTQALPPQVAMSVTYKTAERKRWGRTYLPGISTGSLTAGGAFDASACDQVGAAHDALISDSLADDFVQMVYSPTTHGAYAVEQIQVDDVADVIRSRRWRNPTHRYLTP